MKEFYTFDDVLIVPKFSNIDSRSEVSLSSNIRSLDLLGLPVISANMDTVTAPRMANTMLKYGAQACLHRFDSIEANTVDFLASCENGQAPMVSIGLGTVELERAETLFKFGAHTFVVDVAHGAQMAVVKQVKALREVLGSHINLVAGNFATADSVTQFIQYTGTAVDAVKVGIGPGSACTTRVKTGVGYPQLSAVKEISESLKNTNIVIIADGGMKKPGDIAKALGAGAHMVMLGGMLAGTDECPGETTYLDELGNLFNPDPSLDFYYNLTKVKKYRGSASQEAYNSQNKNSKHRTAEGESFYVPYKGSVVDILKDIEGGLRSSMTYTNSRTLEEFRSNVEFVRVSASGHSEGLAHGKKD